MNGISFQNTSDSVSHRDAEICVNVWWFTDDTGAVLRLAGKAYALRGDDDQKMETLKSLAATDHLTATHANVPSKFVLTIDGQQFVGAVPSTVLQTDPLPVFDDLINQLEADLLDQVHSVEHEFHWFKPELVEPFLWLATPVYEAADGSLVARVS